MGKKDLLIDMHFGQYKALRVRFQKGIYARFAVAMLYS
jgi:hypothetical protein